MSFLYKYLYFLYLFRTVFELGNIAWENAKNKVYEAVEFYRKLFNKNQYFGV